MKPLAIELRDKISGIEVEDHKAKVSLYADDTEKFIKDHFNVMMSKKTLKRFNKQSVMQINLQKSSMIDLRERRIPQGSFKMLVYWTYWTYNYICTHLSYGTWTVDIGLWTMDHGMRTVDRQWT